MEMYWFYGELDHSKRKRTWSLLKQLSQQFQMPWVIIGDYNEVLTQNDKKGGGQVPPWHFKGFRDTLLHCGLHDLPFNGYPFTWSNRHADNSHTQERLD